MTLTPTTNAMCPYEGHYGVKVIYDFIMDTQYLLFTGAYIFYLNLWVWGTLFFPALEPSRCPPPPHLNHRNKMQWTLGLNKIQWMFGQKKTKSTHSLNSCVDTVMIINVTACRQNVVFCIIATTYLLSRHIDFLDLYHKFLSILFPS